MNRAHNLFRLQQIDLEIDKNKARLAEITKILGDDAELNRAVDTREKAEAKLADTRVSLQSAEGLVSTQRFKNEQTEKKLYSGTVQNPRELQDLQMESESLNRYLATLEDRLLDAMVAHEDAESEADSALSQLELIQIRRKHELEDLHEEHSHIMKDQLRLENNREAALAIIPTDDLSLYDRLRKKQSGLAIALLEGSNCNLCGLATGSSIQQTIRSGTDLIQCKQCNRILYAG
jgi:predicted  nucleic acid-binding Zn-ribbon protein